MGIVYHNFAGFQQKKRATNGRPYNAENPDSGGIALENMEFKDE
jgi:hypothetical protein